MKALSLAASDGPKTNGLKLTLATLLKLLYTGSPIRPSDLLSRALDTLLLDLVARLFPLECNNAGSMDAIREFTSALTDAQFRSLRLPEKYWWHLRNLPEVSEIWPFFYIPRMRFL